MNVKSQIGFSATRRRAQLALEDRLVAGVDHPEKQMTCIINSKIKWGPKNQSSPVSNGQIVQILK